MIIMIVKGMDKEILLVLMTMMMHTTNNTMAHVFVHKRRFRAGWHNAGGSGVSYFDAARNKGMYRNASVKKWRDARIGG